MSIRDLFLRIVFVFVLSPIDGGYSHPGNPIQSSHPIRSAVKRDNPWLVPVYRILELKEQVGEVLFSDEELRGSLRRILIQFTEVETHFPIGSISEEATELISEMKQLLDQAAPGGNLYTHLALLAQRAERFLSSLEDSSSLEVGSLNNPGNSDAKIDIVTNDIIDDKNRTPKTLAQNLSSRQSVELIHIVMPWISTDYFGAGDLVNGIRVFRERQYHWKKTLGNRVVPIWEVLQFVPRVPLLALASSDRINNNSEKRISKRQEQALIRSYLTPICQRLNVCLVNFSVRERWENEVNVRKVSKLAHGPIHRTGIQYPIVTDWVPLEEINDDKYVGHSIGIASCFCIVGLSALGASSIGPYLGASFVGLGTGVCGYAFRCCRGEAEGYVPHLVFDRLFVDLGPKWERFPSEALIDEIPGVETDEAEEADIHPLI